MEVMCSWLAITYTISVTTEAGFRKIRIIAIPMETRMLKIYKQIHQVLTKYWFPIFFFISGRLQYL